ncbi:hypothetical protein [Streptomyces specialis]|uniref:hypothetical protein n=1 Tax=Streptomyces specialis TaxID=498367 RepID=UPI001F23B3FD|nr:hypothetical protein [Streptomyces specialis]
MTTIAVTGHMDLTAASAVLVRQALTGLLRGYAPGDLTGVSCLAEGADALFAEAVLEAGGRLVVVIPSVNYRQEQGSTAYADTFDRLAGAADEVVVLPNEVADPRAYEAANQVLLERADRLVAVWNGRPAPGRNGGPAHAVEQARAAGLPVDVVWPPGAARLGDGGDAPVPAPTPAPGCPRGSSA